MSPKLPQVSGKILVKLFENMGYVVIRQKGSHIRLRKKTRAGEHNITVPAHRIIAKGTLNDILSKISLWNDVSKRAEKEMGRRKQEPQINAELREDVLVGLCPLSAVRASALTDKLLPHFSAGWAPLGPSLECGNSC